MSSVDNVTILRDARNDTSKGKLIETQNKDVNKDLLGKADVAVGGNAINAPASSLYRESDYLVMINEQKIPSIICPIFQNNRFYEDKTNDDCFQEDYKRNPRDCMKCINKDDYKKDILKIINKQVRMDSSHKTNILSSKMYFKKNKSCVKKNVPTRGNSRKSSITSLRPGSLSACGKGVHVKHGSYERRLLELKKKSLYSN